MKLDHGLRTQVEKIVFTAPQKINSQSQIFRYGWSIFCLPHWPKFSDFFDLYLHWVSVVRGLNLHASLVNSQKIATDKWQFYDHICPFFANYMFIFLKSKIQTVILRCLISLNLIWYKNFYKKHKKHKKCKFVFLYKIAKERKWKYLHFVS